MNNNKYDEVFDFRNATLEDVDAIMTFLKEEWGEKHILANDKDFFLYQYQGQGDEVHVYLMLDKKGMIQGLNGYIQYSEDIERRYISSAITKVRPNLPVPMSGVEMIRRFREYTSAKAYFSSGTNPVTMAPLVKRAFKYDIGLMQQYYILNKSIKDFKIAVVPKMLQTTCLDDSKLRMLPINRIEEAKDFDFSLKYPRLPYKAKEYFDKRFFKHPIYQYQAYAIQYDDSIKGIMFMRIVKVNDSAAIRIVDYVGDINYIGKCGSEIQRIIQKENAEYADFLLNGMPVEIMNEAGFQRRELNQQETVIPIYFEPFVQKNVDIWYKSSDTDIIIFKADGDQDRPNHR